MKIPEYIIRDAKDKRLFASVRIGKEGVTDQVIKELESQLRNREIIKVKANRQILSSSGERNEVFSKLAKDTDSSLILQRGNVAVYWRKNT
jgi:RNA-binding protein YhbY|tara:strand:- start:645 stop:917 length:273 start_codon:yes stop_codon:yes gene_type:complete